MILPAWMQQAIRNRIINEAEACEIHRICLASDQEEVLMPTHLCNAWERIQLWELDTSPTIH